MADDGTATQSQSTESRRAAGCLVRMAWLAGGTMVLTVLAVLISRSERWTLTSLDVAYGLILTLVAALRYVDGRWSGAARETGDPAGSNGMGRNVAVLVAGWSALWILSQSVELG